MRFHQGGKHSDEYFSRYFTTEDKLSCLRPRVHRVFVPGSKAPSVLYDNSMWTATAAGWMMILHGLLSVCFLSEEDVGDVMTHRRQEYSEYHR